MENNDNHLLDLTANIVSAFVGRTQIDTTALPSLIQSVYQSLNGLAAPVDEVVVQVEEKKAPAVSVRASIKPDYIVCLEDGKKLKMLKRYLMTHYNMTPEEYKAKWGLAKDYPMVAPNYSEKRSSLAKAAGLGAKGRGGRKARR